jgi:DNA end-binding protein Ku
VNALKAREIVDRTLYLGETVLDGRSGHPGCGFVAVSKVALRSRERLALLRPRHGMLILQTLLWQDELRDPGDLAPSTPVTDRELELAEVLIREFAGISVGDVHDEYAHALEQLVDAKITGGELVESMEPAPARDLMAALEESVPAAERARGRPSARPRP